MFDPDDKKSLEKYSSAATLSDMEMFIFPELIYSLTLANIMSPLLWEWRNDPWFSKMARMNQYRRVLRVKQFVMDKFVFNLDLDTWGLTTKPREMARFSDFINADYLAQSNALFGYEGDKYYFDIDIRRHFGLDKYTTDVIPYWKTETLEAMSAFVHKKGYPTGAGECVSLSTLYAAALFVLAKIPLEDIYLMATPLHSQNFVTIRDGIITNNRRIVTKNMWYNGTELSSKARRALQNERVTLVVNNTGFVHTLYDEATMNRESYEKFGTTLKSFLTSDITYEIIANFLRCKSSLQKFFQYEHSCCGKPRYIEVEKLYAYEHSSRARLGSNTQGDLIHEIDEDEFYPAPLKGRIMLNEIEEFFSDKNVSLDHEVNMEKLKKSLHHSCYCVEDVVNDLIDFCRIEPRLPGENKNWKAQEPITLDPSQGRDAVVAQLESLRSTNEMVDLAFSAYRDMNKAPWKPFVKAAIERNPVCVENCKDETIADIYHKISAFEDESIYDNSRVAQPDEVWNFERGAGVEKALCFIAIARQGNLRSDTHIEMVVSGSELLVTIGTEKFSFLNNKEVSLPRADDLNW